MMGLGLLLVLAAIYFIFKKTTFSNAMDAESPLDLLKKRYIKGKITKEEYLEKKKTMGNL